VKNTIIGVVFVTRGVKQITSIKEVFKILTSLVRDPNTDYLH